MPTIEEPGGFAAHAPAVRHVPELDGVRGLAILLVMFGHFWLGSHPVTRMESGVYDIIQNGWVGVDLFFVLSGFLITGILLDAKGKDGYFRNFYARRALRIFPLYYAFLFFWFAILPRVIHLDAGGPFASGRENAIWFWTYTSNWLSLVKGAQIPLGLNHFWTLAIEEQFYLIWPAIVLITSQRTLRWICVVLLPLELLFRLWLMTTPYGHTAGFVLTPARVGTLAVGAWLACALREPQLRERVEHHAFKVFVVAAVGVAALYPDLLMQASHKRMQTIGFPLLAFASAALITLAVRSTRENVWLKRTFRSRVMRFFGKYSYGMYVLHLPITVLLEGVGFTIVALPRVGGSDVPAAILFSFVALATTVVLSLLSWHLYEKQFLKLKERFR